MLSRRNAGSPKDSDTGVEKNIHCYPRAVTIACMATTGLERGTVSRDRIIIVVSFLGWVLSGSAYIAWRWLSHHEPNMAALRCFTFLCLVGAFHVWGWQLYRRQTIPEAKAAGLTHADVVLEYAASDRATTQSGVSFGFIILQQAAGLLFASMVLDGGTMATACGISVVVYWLAVIVGVCIRRQPTATDRALLHVGFWPLFAVVLAAFLLVSRLAGI